MTGRKTFSKRIRDLEYKIAKNGDVDGKLTAQIAKLVAAKIEAKARTVGSDNLPSEAPMLVPYVGPRFRMTAGGPVYY